MKGSNYIYNDFSHTTVCSVWDKGYRYGFNSMEKDNEINVNGGSYDFGARIYDSRLGRWMSLDPLQMKYPSMSPYNFCLNNPIVYIDPSGKSAIISINANNEVTIKINLKLYGEAAAKLTTEDIANLANNISIMMDEAVVEYLAGNGSKINVGGIDVSKVNFIVNAEFVQGGKAQLDKDHLENTDLSNNYILVEEGAGSSSMKNKRNEIKNEDGTSSYEFFGGDKGVFKLDELYDKGKTSIGGLKSKQTLEIIENNGFDAPKQPEISTTPLHEVLHSLGLLGTADGGNKEGHSNPPTSQEVKDKTKPFNVMSGRGEGVTSYNRRPDKSTIKALHLENVKLTEDKKNQTKSGTLGRKTTE